MRRQCQFYDEILKMINYLMTLFFVPSASLILLMTVGSMSATAQAAVLMTGQPPRTEERICLSLKILMMEAKKDPVKQEVKNLAGIGWLEGFVVDSDNRDIILIGRQTLNSPTLHIDDLVVNMRNVWNNESYPYCSLDPRPEDIRKLNQLASQSGTVSSVEQMNGFVQRLKESWGSQSVVVGGVPRNSRHAHVMIDADYHMKKISQGLLKLPGIRSYLDIVLDDAKKQVAYTGRIASVGVSMSRFWFHLGRGEPIYQESDQIVCLDRCSVTVLTEKQRSTVDGKLYDAVEADPQANTFAQELSKHFHKAATLVPEYAELENLYRLSAILRAMHFMETADRVGLDLSNFLKDYRYQNEITMMPSLAGLTNSKEVQGQVKLGGSFYQYVLFPIVCGGVSMEVNLDRSNFVKTKQTQMNKLRKAVISSRPSTKTFSWSVTVTVS